MTCIVAAKHKYSAAVCQALWLCRIYYYYYW